MTHDHDRSSRSPTQRGVPHCARRARTHRDIGDARVCGLPPVRLRRGRAARYAFGPTRCTTRRCSTCATARGRDADRRDRRRPHGVTAARRPARPSFPACFPSADPRCLRLLTPRRATRSVSAPSACSRTLRRVGGASRRRACSRTASSARHDDGGGGGPGWSPCRGSCVTRAPAASDLRLPFPRGWRPRPPCSARLDRPRRRPPRRVGRRAGRAGSGARSDRGACVGRGWPEHPAFGPMTRATGGCCVPPLDHHFRQFGLSRAGHVIDDDAPRDAPPLAAIMPSRSRRHRVRHRDPPGWSAPCAGGTRAPTPTRCPSCSSSTPISSARRDDATARGGVDAAWIGATVRAVAAWAPARLTSSARSGLAKLRLWCLTADGCCWCSAASPESAALSLAVSR